MDCSLASSQRQSQTLSLPIFRLLNCGKNNFSSTVQEYLNIFGFKSIFIFTLGSYFFFFFGPRCQNHKFVSFIIDYHSTVHDFGVGFHSAA